MKLRHLIEPEDFTTEEFENLFRVADNIINDPIKYSNTCKGKILASLFFEPSTRTRFSFESAMIRLGGNVIGFSDPMSTSSSKGESLTDTLKIVEGYADIAAMRHPREGAARLGARKLEKMPVINAGDGGHLHPTQTLTDLMTIRKYKGRLEDLTIGFCGDLKFGRTVHSLIKAMNRYENIKFKFISPEELKLPRYFKDILKEDSYEEVESLEDCIGSLDILYMTRVQKERFVSEEEYLRLKDYYILNTEKLKRASNDMIIMHPLPRVNEISEEIDEDERAVYFQQAQLGVFVRMALILFLLNIEVWKNDKCF